MEDKVADLLKEMVICELGSKVVDGVTYFSLIKGNEADEKKYKRYIAIDKYCKEQYGERGSCIEINSVVNGYVINIGIEMAKSIICKIAEESNIDSDIRNVIGNKPEKSRENECEKLGKYLLDRYKDNKMESEIVLYSTTKSDVSNNVGVDASGQNIRVCYRTFAITHNEIEGVNEKYLVPHGIRIKEIKPCEVLSRRQGVVFGVTVESIKDFFERRQ